MNVLVTGANGHIGNHVVRACLAAGMKPAAMVRPGSDRRALAGFDVEIREGDIVLCELFAKETGIRPRAMLPPKFLLRWIAGAAERRARKTGEDAAVTRDAVDDVYERHLAYDATRARNELDVTFRPAGGVLRDAVRWVLFMDALKPKVAARVRAAMGAAAAPDPDWTR